MFNSDLYAIWRKKLKQFIPDNCQTRLTNLRLFIVGMYEAQSVHLTHIAKYIPIAVRKASIVKRLRRFLANDAVETRTWYHPWASWLLQSAASGGQINLIVDATKVTSSHQLLCVSVGYRRRALPIAWDWIPQAKGRSTTQKQLELLAYVQSILPNNCHVSLVGDTEFGDAPIIDALQEWGWDYVLRQAKDTKVLLKESYEWQRLDELDLSVGDEQYHRRVLLTEAHEHPTHLVLVWQAGEKRPWYLATNQRDVVAAKQLYKRRMWIEEMFGDFKKHGVDIEMSRLHHAPRLSRLMLVASLVYVWLVTLGEYVINQGLTATVDRASRNDLSIFRLGLDWLTRQLKLQQTIPDRLCPDLSLMCVIPRRQGASKQQMTPYF